MYMGHIHYDRWTIMLWPRLAFGYGTYPKDGPYKGYIFDWWMTPLIEVRRFKEMKELR